ncbi:MAG: MFS transporter [Lapillicoccus sp.]
MTGQRVSPAPLRPGVGHASRSAAVAIGSLFATNGLIIGAYAGVLPALRERYGVDAGAVAALLVVVGAMAVASMQVGGRLADRVGARRITLAALPLMVVGALVMAWAPSYPFAVLGGALIGLGNGANDVSMNAIGVVLEQARRSPVMSRFHAFWSVGSFLGAGVVLLTSRLVADTKGAIVAPALIAVAVVGGLALAVTTRWVPVTSPVPEAVSGESRPIPPIAWLLGGMAVCFGLMEGSAFDWSSIHVTDVAGVDPGLGASGLVTVTVFMVGLRLVGDAAVTRFGHRVVVRGGSLVAAVGFAVTVVATALPVILVGWALVGAGVAMIAPQIYAAAGHLGGARMLAVVVTFGYAAFLSGPAIVGWLVHTVGVRHAMALPLVLSGVLVVVSRWMPSVRS